MATTVTFPLPKWITSNKNPLGTIKENEYFEFLLDAYSPAGSGLTYTLVAGKLPPGIQLRRTGVLQGIPVITNAVEEFDSYTFNFTIRVTDRNNRVADKTFSINVNAIVPPEIIPTTINLGSYYVGTYFNKQLTVLDPNPLQNFRWSVVNGSLPSGVTLDQTGLLSGYLMPRDTSQDTEYTIENHHGSFDGLPFDSTPFSPSVLGLDPVEAFKVYTFDVEVFDGNAVDKQRYQIVVYAKNILTVDNTSILVNGKPAIGDFYTADMSNRTIPILLTRSQELPQTRQRSNFAFKFDAIDLDGDEIRFGIFSSGQTYFDQGPTIAQPYINLLGFDSAPFDQESQDLPSGITLDPVTGWLTGHLGPQTEYEKVYRFNIFVYRKNDPGTFSASVMFTLRVLGDLNNVIHWESPEFLGEMYNGDYSHFRIKASTPSLKPLFYKFDSDPRTLEGNYNRLPQGLKLLPNGLISGRASFRYFSLDGGKTTLDHKSLTFDSEYTFSVLASDEEIIVDDPNLPPMVKPATISSVKTFKIRVNNRNSIPYDNLWLRAFPNREQRGKFTEIINDSNFFPDELIYRIEDPNFGKAKDIKFLFLPGLHPATAEQYVRSMENHHYRKRIELGNVKTAIAVDKNFNVKYEVVYVEVFDNMLYANKNPKNEVVHLNTKNPYYDEYLQIYRTFYPNDYNNMIKEVVNEIGFSNKGALPEWMTSPQADGRVLGFTRAIVLAYTVPGASNLIAYRLRSSNIQFNDIDFQLDRYQIDNYLSTYYDPIDKKFVDSLETTFDRLESTEDDFTYVKTVDYAVTIPFSEINGRTRKYINNRGGIDRIFDYKTGDLLIFVVQERFETYSQSLIEFDYFDGNNFDSQQFSGSVTPFTATDGYENDGWNIYAGLFSGENAFDSRPLDNVSVIPGAIESLVDPSVVNQRMGIWKIEIIDDVVFLKFVMPVNRFEYVIVRNGFTYRDTKLYHDPTIKPGYTVPSFSVLANIVNIANSTTRFDQGSTRFIDNRDKYTLPGVNDKYLHFPKLGVFH